MAKIVVVKIENGNVKGYDSKGSCVGLIGSSNAVSAVVNGDVVTITYKYGQVILYDANSGSSIRVL
jgi:hypothetical protein